MDKTTKQVKVQKIYVAYAVNQASKICKTDWVKFAINVERLRKRGLIFLLDQYEKVHVEIN